MPETMQWSSSHAQAAGAEAQAARAAADEASNALAKVRSEAAALSRRVTEDGEALTAREQSLEAVTLERQRLRVGSPTFDSVQKSP